MTDFATLDATAQAELVRDGDLSPLELVDAAITRVEKCNPELNAVIHPLFERGHTTARKPLEGPFAGVPIVVKDLDGELAGAPLHLGNELLKQIGHVGTEDSYLFARLEQAGFVVIGKTNTPEFGLQATTEPHAYGPTRNPWDTDHSTGGSSGGSAAAVASGMVPVAHAGDGGGSIRIPASECGLVGLKPTRGRTSLGPHEGESWNGLVARHVVTRSVRDCAAVLDAVSGEMPGDPYTAPPPARPFLAEVGTPPGRLRIGLRTTAPAAMAEVDEECVVAAEEAARMLEALGHSVEPASPAALEETELLELFVNVLATNTLVDVEELARIVGRPITAEDVEPGTWALAEMGRSVTALAYAQTLQTAQAWTRRVLQWWHGGSFDLLLTPTLGAPPARLGFLNPTDGDPFLATARQTPYAAFTAAFNVTGQPAISLPLYHSASGLPIGVQLVAAACREDVLLRVAAQLEAAHPWAERRPPVFAA
ncbi:MAG: amidase [Actinobacteria bacterium]|nr:amidase [Actinomycetota bacterium]